MNEESYSDIVRCMFDNLGCSGCSHSLQSIGYLYECKYKFTSYRLAQLLRRISIDIER